MYGILQSQHPSAQNELNLQLSSCTAPVLTTA